jgi:elongation factor 1 alpha-like protein
MDCEGWKESRYRDIVKILGTFLKQTGFNEKRVCYVPCSGYLGQNIQSLNEPKASESF